MTGTHHFKAKTKPTASEDVIIDYIKQNFGHFVTFTDDRFFVNIFRRVVVSELGLPSSAMTAVSSEEILLRTRERNERQTQKRDRLHANNVQQQAPG